MTTRLRRVKPDAVGETIVEADELQARVRELAVQISRDYAGRELLLLGVLKGAVFFVADLVRQLDVPCELDFMAVSSYGSLTDSSGVVRILKDLDAPIEGKDVLIVEDIVDSGLTLNYLLRNLRGARPALARGLRPAREAGEGARSTFRSATSGSRSRIATWSATGSISTSATGTCRTSRRGGRLVRTRALKPGSIRTIRRGTLFFGEAYDLATSLSGRRAGARASHRGTS